MQRLESASKGQDSWLNSKMESDPDIQKEVSCSCTAVCRDLVSSISHILGHVCMPPQPKFERVLSPLPCRWPTLVDGIADDAANRCMTEK
jgi:hypothetical protein